MGHTGVGGGLRCKDKQDPQLQMPRGRGPQL